MTYYADVSEWQTALNEAYPHRIVCIRSNDGTYRDAKWATNHAWCKRQADAGKLDCFLVYMVYRTNWQQTLDTFKSQVGIPHPKMVAMVDVESWGGQIGGNQSAGINNLISGLATFLGDRKRVIAYGNRGDLDSLWPSKPADTKLIVAGYSATKPGYTNMIGWQYTDGQGYGPSGWAQGASPFGNCDMNYTDLSSTDFAAQCGVGGFLMSAADSANAAQLGPATTWGKTPRQIAAGYDPDKVGEWAREAIEKSAVELAQKLPSRSEFRDSDDAIDTLAGIVLNVDARLHELSTVLLALLVGHGPAVEVLKAHKDSVLAAAVLAKLGVA